MFTNREIAIIIWIFIFLLYFFIKTDIKKSLKNVIKAMFSKKLLFLCFVIYTYMIIYIFFLYKIKFWSIELLKDTIIWLITVPIFSIMKAEEDSNKYFKETLKSCFEVYILIEFIGLNYPFNICIELIIIPIVLLLSLVGEFAEKFGETKEVSIFAYIIVIIISALAFIHSIRLAISDIQNIFTIDVLKNIVYVPILTIAYIPMIYLILIFMNYETFWFRVNCKKYLSKKDKRMIMIKAIKNCKLSLKRVKDIKLKEYVDIKEY